MNKKTRRYTKRQLQQNARRFTTTAYVLIAVVAIIECLLLISFTTFSWIESNSSLVIQNGPESSQVDTNVTKKMDITDELNSTINLNYSGDTFAPLNNFFSEVKYFEFAKATSSDGRTIFFPCRNNTYSEAGKYRKGDTIDYNTSYLYFDFVMSNKAHDGGPATIENRDVYFDDTEGYTDIFTVTGDGLTSAQKTALTNAMRMSITTQTGSSLSTKIYAKEAYSASSGYKSIDDIPLAQSYAYDENGGVGHANNRNTGVETKQLSGSVYHTTNNVIDAEKLFVVKKNADTKVSFRIWFDVWDPDFRSEFGLDSLDYSDFEDSDAAYWDIPDATVGIKFRLKTSGNDLRSIYFDDYTFSNNAGVNINHLTDENPNYSVWFYAWQPAVAASTDHPARTAGYYVIPLTRESRDATHTLWSANTATASMMEYLMNQGGYPNATGVSGATRYQKSYFCYGDYSTKTAVYKWELPAAPVSEDFVFNAYSYMPNSSANKTTYNWTSDSTGTTWRDCNGTGVKSGVGIWQDDAASSMTLLKFRDMATAVTSDNYNGGANYQIMNAQAESDNHTNYLVYANNYNNATLSNNFTDSVAKISAAMYYDDSEEVFKSYVPAGWLTGTNTGVSFTYCPGGVFSASGATLRWYNSWTDSPPSQLDGVYMYTALGYSNHYNYSNSTLGRICYTAGVFSSSGGFLKGVGTWSDVQLLHFNTELIDANLNSGYRYLVGIPDSYSAGYYAMIPDESNMVFSAYIPVGTGSNTAGQIKFLRYNAVKTTSGAAEANPAVYWHGNTRGTYSTFYPVNCTGTSTVEYTHGYWNLSVLVDATYENLIYDTLTDGTGSSCTPTVTADPDDADNNIVDYSPRDNYGLLEYSYDGQNYTTIADDTSNTLNNSLDRFRFYVPAENQRTVYWRWTPYQNYTITFTSGGTSKTVVAADTQFEYTHDVTDAASTGIYKIITEAPYIPLA